MRRPTTGCRPITSKKDPLTTPRLTRGLMSTPRTSVKMAALAPMPSASVMTATDVNPSDLRSWRRANLRSFIPLSLRGDPVFNDTAVKQMHGAIGMLSEALVVRDHANCGATLMQFSEQTHDRFAIARVKVSSRLVRQQNRRPAGKRTRDCDTLLLATRELTGQMFCSMRHANSLQSFGDKRFAVTGAHAAIGQRQFNILKNAEIAD